MLEEEEALDRLLQLCPTPCLDLNQASPRSLLLVLPPVGWELDDLLPTDSGAAVMGWGSMPEKLKACVVGRGKIVGSTGSGAQAPTDAFLSDS